MSIPNDLKELIEDPNDVYDLYFKNPDQLLEIFATLEEKNLFLIQQGQEAEQQLAAAHIVAVAEMDAGNIATDAGAHLD